MSSSDRDTVDMVEKHLAERRKVVGWLDALAERRADTAPAVYQRVHDDYTAKLDKVQAKLMAASDAVQVAAADLAGRLTDKEQGVVIKRDERAEAELRAAVGEFSEREWEKRRTKLDDELSVATGERDGLREELSRLRAVLAEVTGSGAPPDAEAAGAIESSAEESAAVGEGRAPVAPADAPSASDAANAITDEHQAVTAPHPAIPIHEQSIIAPVEPAQPLAPSFDELAFLKSVVGRPTPASTRSMPEPTTMASSAASAEALAPDAAPETDPMYGVPEPPAPYPDPVPEPRVSREMTPPRESYFTRPSVSDNEAGKSLRCQECGTLNFPTEWYCERCGGELAAF